MADKTIPQLVEATTATETGMVVVDTGVQTFRMSLLNLARNIRRLKVKIGLSDSPFTLTAAHLGAEIMVETSTGAVTVVLVNLEKFNFVLRDVDGRADTYPITVQRAGADTIDGLTADKTCDAKFGRWDFAIEQYTPTAKWYS